MLVYDVPTTTRFRGLTRRQGMLVRGDAGWGEWSPFAEYVSPEIDAWWAAAVEAADEGFPPAVRDRVAVNCTIPAVGPDFAAELTRSSGCGTAKVKVAERGQTLADDLARIEAVRDALGPAGAVRVDANGAWDVDEAFQSLVRLHRLAGLEYAEQPCATVEELADLRRRLARSGVDVRIVSLYSESLSPPGTPAATYLEMMRANTDAIATGLR